VTDGIFEHRREAATPSASTSPRSNEPEIYSAVRFGTVLENAVYDDRTRAVDYRDASLTENTRASPIPIEFIPNAKVPCVE
jgi:phosphoenolpyruvate carboxykinase (ATP)